MRQLVLTALLFFFLPLSISAQNSFTLRYYQDRAPLNEQISQAQLNYENTDGFGIKPELKTKIKIAQQRGHNQPKTVLGKYGQTIELEGVREPFYPVGLEFNVPVSSLPFDPIFIVGINHEFARDNYQSTSYLGGTSLFFNERMTQLSISLSYSLSRVPTDYYLNLLGQSMKEDTSVKNFQTDLSLTQILTSTLIGGISFSFIDHSRRPYGYGGSAFLSKYIKGIDTAIKLKGSYFEEENDLKTTSHFGVIKSTNVISMISHTFNPFSDYEFDGSLYGRFGYEKEIISDLDKDFFSRSFLAGLELKIPFNELTLLSMNIGKLFVYKEEDSLFFQISLTRQIVGI